MPAFLAILVHLSKEEEGCSLLVFQKFWHLVLVSFLLTPPMLPDHHKQSLFCVHAPAPALLIHLLLQDFITNLQLLFLEPGGLSKELLFASLCSSIFEVNT